MDYRMPIHIQLSEIIREKIEEGEYKPGEMIPSEREMAALYGINRMTVKNAINSLVKEGLLEKKHGKGTFVSVDRVMRDLQGLTGLSAAMKEKGITPSSRLILSEVIEEYSRLNRILNIEPLGKVFRILRLRLGDGEPFALEDTYVPYDLFPGISNVDFEKVSLYEYMEAKEVKVDISYQTLTLAKVNAREGKLLSIPPETDIFLFEYLSKDEGGRVVEYTKSYTRGDKTIYKVLLQ